MVKRKSTKEEFEDTKGANRICMSMYRNVRRFSKGTNTIRISMSRNVGRVSKVVIRIRISKKDRQHNGQKKKYKRTNNDLQNVHIKLKIE